MKNISEGIMQWAQADENVKVLILLGSHAAGQADEYSDYDLAVFCSSDEPYIKNDSWISKFGKIWVCVHEKLQEGDHMYSTRLVIFEGGLKVDFAFFPMLVLQDMMKANSLPDEYNRGFSVLLDKGSWTASMPKATKKESPGTKPSEQEFLRIVNEFWFEVHHVAKYLKRKDLWSAKFRSGGIYDNFLLKMIEWNEEAKRDWKTQMPPLGKRMRTWVDAHTWKALYDVFGHFEEEDSWKALVNTIGLFRELAKDTAHRLGYMYPQDVDEAINGYVLGLKGA